MTALNFLLVVSDSISNFVSGVFFVAQIYKGNS